jgi:hypothetical protein
VSSPRIVLGVDFDNTIVRYDALFHRVACELGVLAPGVAANKNAVRDYLNSTGRKDVFTEMQGTIYGTRMAEAEGCPGAIETLTALTRAGVTIFIISHKTRTPLVGAPHDLHAAARGWLELNGFFDPARVGLTREQVLFEVTKEAKVARIAACGCTHFVDDLPEILFHPAFPAGVERVLYDPENHTATPGPCTRLTAWTDLPALLRQP